jgi:hypothetical protein
VTYNKSLKNLETKLKVVQLYNDGKSCVEIGKLLNIPARTLQDFMARNTHQEFWTWLDGDDSWITGEYSSVEGPKILFLDVEVSASIVAAFSMFKHYSTPDHVIEFPYILTFAANWLHDPEDKIIAKGLNDYNLFDDNHKSDRLLVEDLWSLLNEADIVVAQNAMFDIGWATQRFAYHGLPEPSPYRLVCTLKGLKKAMSLPSNSLGYSTKYFDLGHKKLHNDGIALWIGCMNGDNESFDKMKEYNIGDIPTLRELYLLIRPHIPNHPNLALYYPDSEHRCGVCGSDSMVKLEKNAFTNLSEYHSYRCSECGTVRRSGKALTTGTQRARFTRAVIK